MVGVVVAGPGRGGRTRGAAGSRRHHGAQLLVNLSVNTHTESSLQFDGSGCLAGRVRLIYGPYRYRNAMTAITVDDQWRVGLYKRLLLFFASAANRHQLTNRPLITGYRSFGTAGRLSSHRWRMRGAFPLGSEMD